MPDVQAASFKLETACREESDNIEELFEQLLIPLNIALKGIDALEEDDINKSD